MTAAQEVAAGDLTSYKKKKKKKKKKKTTFKTKCKSFINSVDCPLQGKKPRHISVTTELFPLVLQ